METTSNIMFRETGPLTLLFALLGALTLLFVIGASDDAGAATWESSETLDTQMWNWQCVDTDGEYVYVAYTKEIDGYPYNFFRYYNGTTWSDPAPVYSDQVSTREVRMVAENGIAHFVYVSWDGDFDVIYSNFNVRTGSWARPFSLSSTTKGVSAEGPCIAIDDGNLHVAWHEDLDGDDDIYYKTSHMGYVWSQVTKLNLDTSDENQTWPDIAAVDGEVHVVWRDQRRSDYDIFYRHYNGTWHTITDISRDDLNQYEPGVIVSAMGVHVFYSTWEDPNMHTYMSTYDGSWSTPEYVGRARSSTSEYDVDMKAEGGNLALMYRTDDNPNNIVLRQYMNGRWNAEANVFTNPTGSFMNLDLHLVGGVLHMAYPQYDPSQGCFVLKYTSTALDQATPSATVDAVAPYWMDGGRMSLPWMAQDDYGLTSVTVQYRYSADNATWDRWTVVTTNDANGYLATGAASFTPTDGDGFYEFKAYATDLAGKQEDASMEPETMGGLDTADPTGSILINGGDDYTQGPTVTLSVTYEDATSGVVNVRFANEAIGGDEPWENPVDTKEWEVGSEGGLVTVCYQVLDLSGLVSQVYTATITVDSDTPTGAISLASGATTVNSPNVTLTLSYDDATSPVVGIRVTEEAIGGDEPWENPVETLEFTLSVGGGVKDINFQVIDAAGLVSDIYKLTITLDIINPFVESAGPDDAEEKVGVDADVVVRFSEPMDRTSVETAFSLEYIKDGATINVAGTFNWSPDMRTLTYSPSVDLEKGTEHTMSLTNGAMDVAGNGVFPAISYKFTTEKGASGDGGDDGGGNLLPIVGILLVLVIVAVVGALLYMRQRGGTGRGTGN